MNTIIEKIRAEVNRMKEEHQVPTFRGDEYEEGGVNGYQLALDKVLAKLSDLEKECQWSAEDETKIAYICDVMSGKELVSDISPSYRSEIIEFAKSLRPAKVKSEKPTNPTLQEQPVCEGLEEECLTPFKLVAGCIDDTLKEKAKEVSANEIEGGLT